MSIGKNITRKDIAREAGVSVSVVSRALNNSGYVNKEKKKRIIEIANKMDYMPNPVAMALQQKKTYQLLFFCGDLTGVYYNQMYHGMTLSYYGGAALFERMQAFRWNLRPYDTLS